MKKATTKHFDTRQNETHANDGTSTPTLNFLGKTHSSLSIACEHKGAMPSQDREETLSAKSHKQALAGSWATLWADNPDITAMLQFLFDRSGFHLAIVTTANEVLDAATYARSGDFLIIDCITATDALERCTLVVTRTTVPVHICHSDKEFVDNLQVAARCEVIWLPPTQTGLSLLNKLRLLKTRSFSFANDQPSNPLTTREAEVLRLIAIGLTNSQIAERLCLSQSTIKTHVAEIKRKLALTTRADLISAYYKSV